MGREQIKCNPESFRVREELSIKLMSKGPFGVYRLSKRKASTLEAIGRIAQAGRFPVKDIHFAGLKDRQALTEQLITIPGRVIYYQDAQVKLEHLGRTKDPTPWSAGYRNRFDILVNGLSSKDVKEASQRFNSISEAGFINYFDNQRFGCLRYGQGYIGLMLAKGQVEQALKVLVATPLSGDPPHIARMKSYLSRNWNQWDKINVRRLPSPQKQVFIHLYRNVGDWAGALMKLERRLVLLHLFSWQSWLWNETVRLFLTQWLSSRQLPFQMVPYLAGGMCFPDTRLHAELGEVMVPYPAGLEKPADPNLAQMMEQVVQAEGIRWEDLTLKALPSMDLSRENRALVIFPEDTAFIPIKSGPRANGQGVRLKFSLPPGAYATILLRTVFLGANLSL